MEGIRAEVLPPNQKDFDEYFTFGWTFVHTLTAAATALEPEIGTTNDLDRFKPYLEAEEARLAANLTAVDYVIDGVDTLTLITGVGRIEKVCTKENAFINSFVSSKHGVLQTVFPLIYLLLKRHYEIMRAMRTKVLDSRELGSGIASFGNVNDVIRWRINDLTSASHKFPIPGCITYDQRRHIFPSEA